MGSTGFFLEVAFSKTKNAHALYSISFKTDDLNVVKNTVTTDSLSAQEQSTVGVPKEILWSPEAHHFTAWIPNLI